MTAQTEEKILKELGEIKLLLRRLIPPDSEPPDRRELTEDDLLRIVAEGRREYREGKTKQFDELIAEEYPHLLTGR